MARIFIDTRACLFIPNLIHREPLSQRVTQGQSGNVTKQGVRMDPRRGGILSCELKSAIAVRSTAWRGSMHRVIAPHLREARMGTIIRSKQFYTRHIAKNS